MGVAHEHVLFFIAIAVAAVGAWLDWRLGEIPNWLTVPVILGAPVVHVIRFAATNETMDAAFYEGAYSIGGAALCAVVPLLLFRQSAIGGGDVKLFIAIGAFFSRNGVSRRRCMPSSAAPSLHLRGLHTRASSS
jgi:prepilin peptidase CpaA